MIPKKYDGIIIGAGIGGLTTGALLAKAGLRILLIEKGHEPGGYVVSFKRGEYLFDATGVFLGGCKEGEEFYEILRKIEAHRTIEFLPIRHIQNIYPGFKVTLEGEGFENYTEALIHLFPEEEKGLRRYLSLVQEIGKEVKAYSEMTFTQKVLFPFYFRHLIRYYRTTHQTILDRLFRGGEIKMALHTLPVTDPPSRLSFLFVAIMISKVLMGGVFYPKGGMGNLSKTLLHSFLHFGGEVLFKKRVEKIIIKGGKVKGIFTKEDDLFEAPLVISNINPFQMVKMLPKEFQRSFSRRLGRLEPSLSCFILYLATDLNLKEMGIPYFTNLRSCSNLEEEDRILRRGEFPEIPTMSISIPTLLDPSLAPPGQHLIKTLIMAPYSYKEEWGREDRETYRRIKEGLMEKVISYLDSKWIPGLREHILYKEAATPITLERYTENHRGAMYGFSSTPQQVGPGRPPHRTPLHGLFQVGHYTRPSHGIVGASLSGLFAAREILKLWHRI